jgi:hypothetical protein
MYGESSGNSWTIAIVVIFGLIFGGVLFAKCGSDLSGHTHDTAQKTADTWLRQMGIKGRAECAATDTDNDDYVSCTVVTTDASGATRIEPLECAGSLTINSGCRAPKAVIRAAK